MAILVDISFDQYMVPTNIEGDQFQSGAIGIQTEMLPTSVVWGEDHGTYIIVFTKPVLQVEQLHRIGSYQPTPLQPSPPICAGTWLIKIAQNV